jgi:hypothetical protein
MAEQLPLFDTKIYTGNIEIYNENCMETMVRIGGVQPT